MQNNNYLSLINFKVKTSLAEIFFLMNTMLEVQIFFGYCKHGVTSGIRTPCALFKSHVE